MAVLQFPGTKIFFFRIIGSDFNSVKTDASLVQALGLFLSGAAFVIYRRTLDSYWTTGSLTWRAHVIFLHAYVGSLIRSTFVESA